MKVSKGQSQPEIVAAFLIVYMLLGSPFLHRSVLIETQVTDRGVHTRAFCRFAQDAWRREVDNTALWRTFGLDSRAGRILHLGAWGACDRQMELGFSVWFRRFPSKHCQRRERPTKKSNSEAKGKEGGSLCGLLGESTAILAQPARRLGLQKKPKGTRFLGTLKDPHVPFSGFHFLAVFQEKGNREN